MKQVKLLFILSMLAQLSYSQSVSERIKTAWEKLQSDSDLRHASSSLYVLNGKTNEVVFDCNSQLGLVPGSSQKVITSVTAYELLGKDFRFKTELAYNGTINNGILNGDLIINGYGDPTLGSWRFSSTRDTAVINDWLTAIKTIGIQKINGDVFLNGNKFPVQSIPGGWSYEDMGNYYGAGCWGLNIHENQFDLTLKPGLEEGDNTTITKTSPELVGVELINNVKTGKPNSDADVNIYLPPYAKIGFIEGVIPPSKSSVTASGSTPNPYYQLAKVLGNALDTAHIAYNKITNIFDAIANQSAVPKIDSIFHTYVSPTLDSITYRFLHKSINLYGEALVKTIAYNKLGEGSTEKGIGIVKQFWQDRGLEVSALRIKDGSGLSTTNRVTTNALANILQYARNKPWYPSFYYALPTFNGMKLKSGTISGIKSFVGYHTSKDGTDYTIAMIINNFNGSSAEMTKKMFIVLDALK
jgi:serine-type D-Ala-D-Ala carboxypeptidase/endopeptidase (penicillin-binding protein 4)